MSKSELIQYWFSHEDIWFNCPTEIDHELKTKFSELLNDTPVDCQEYLHYIILYDQITRHIDRVDNTQLSTEYHPKALEYSNYIIDENLLDKFTNAEICFVLLPLRHSKDRNTIYKALNIIQDIRLRDQTDSYLRRFHYATVRSLVNINVPRCVESTIGNIKNLNILDKDCRYSPGKDVDIKDNGIVNEFKKYVPKREITVSLSGGVDSMVCAFILKYMGYDVLAIHINYNNRECCYREVKMLSIWCQSMSIPLYVRTIDEIQRNMKYDRTFYEDVTKEIRFKAYQFLGRPVVLGHNKDDCLENIISNIKKCQNYDNLNGMRPISEQNGVTVIRPMLHVGKSHIIEVANQCNIPFLQDSTPSWSERGKMRDELIPFLNQFDPRIIAGIMKMANHCSKITETHRKISMESTHIQQDLNKNIEIYFCEEFCDMEFWKQTFHHCQKEYGIGSVSNKSIQNMIDILNSNNPKRKIVLNPTYYAQMIDNDTEYYIERTKLVLYK